MYVIKYKSRPALEGSWVRYRNERSSPSVMPPTSYPSPSLASRETPALSRGDLSSKKEKVFYHISLHVKGG